MGCEIKMYLELALEFATPCPALWKKRRWLVLEETGAFSVSTDLLESDLSHPSFTLEA